MSGPAMRSNVVVGVDGSPASDAAVRWAAREATMRALPIKLINVVAPTLVSSAMAPNHTITQSEELQARQVLKQARRIVEELAGEKPPDIHIQRVYAGVVPTLVDASNDAEMVVVGSSRRKAQSCWANGWPAGKNAIRTCRCAGDWSVTSPDRWLVDESKNAQLVILGSGGRGGYAGMHLGSVTSAVVRSARVPVIVVRDGCNGSAGGDGPNGRRCVGRLWRPSRRGPGDAVRNVSGVAGQRCVGGRCG